MGNIEELLNNMIARLSAEEGQRISEKINLYGLGILGKVKSCGYALRRIEELYHQTDRNVTTTEESIPVSEQVQFYVDSFFAFLYSTFDIMAQIINQKQRVGIDEGRVSFNSILNSLNSANDRSALANKMQRIKRSRYFANLSKYRNCSTHRRPIYIKCEITTTEETPGYNATEPIDAVLRVICDDPLDTTPKTNQDRELLDYCSNMYERTIQELRNISQLI